MVTRQIGLTGEWLNRTGIVGGRIHCIRPPGGLLIVFRLELGRRHIPDRCEQAPISDPQVAYFPSGAPRRRPLRPPQMVISHDGNPIPSHGLKMIPDVPNAHAAAEPH